MTTFLSQSAPVPAAPIRLSLNPHLDRRGSVDGAWWPRTRTRDAAVELLVVPPGSANGPAMAALTLAAAGTVGSPPAQGLRHKENHCA
ncbi:DUF5994 family protein [Nonomuraea antimicrobica]